MASERFLVNPMRRSVHSNKVRRRSSLLSNRLRHKSRSLFRNPLGAELAILGANPFRKEKSYMDWNPRKKTKGKKRGPKKGKRRSAKRGIRRGKKVSAKNLSKRFVKKGRHKVAGTLRINPAISAQRLLGIDFGKVLPIAITGGVSILVTKLTPGLVGVTSTPASYGIKAATAIGGGLVVNKVLGKEHGFTWTVTGLAVIAADAIAEYILPKVLPGRSLAGLSAFIPENELGAFVTENAIDSAAEVDEVDGIDEINEYAY